MLNIIILYNKKRIEIIIKDIIFNKCVIYLYTLISLGAGPAF